MWISEGSGIPEIRCPEQDKDVDYSIHGYTKFYNGVMRILKEGDFRYPKLGLGHGFRISPGIYEILTTSNSIHNKGDE